MACTGSKARLRKLTALTGPLRHLKAGSFPTVALYRNFGLRFIEPELGMGADVAGWAQRMTSGGRRLRTG